MKTKDYSIHWFRRDLRVAGNPALQESFSRSQGRVVGVFCFDKKFLSRSDFSVNRFQFFLETLVHLKQELQSIGSDLLVLDIGPQQAFAQLIEKMKSCDVSLPKTISWNRDYEPFAIKRDAEMRQYFELQQIEVTSQRDHLIVEPDEVFKKSDGSGYSVYTPFSRAWLDVFMSAKVQGQIALQKKAFTYLNRLEKGEAPKLFDLTWKKLFKKHYDFSDVLSEYVSSNKKLTTISIPQSGCLEAYQVLKAFKKRVEDYQRDRDFPLKNATSRLSMFLKNGSITTSQIIHYLNLTFYEKGDDGGKAVFLSELIWREFYYHILYRNPRVEHQAFNKKYLNLKWEDDEALFTSWKEGKTGYPIVDAGMRELKTTGFMHNRVRMITASFLVKHLLIDWRWGEKYFMEQLLDGDLAPNNGGWQWAASTGCDAQPYFRVFNPWLQSKKFDLNGDYIKKYVPELVDCEPKFLHQPILNHHCYPAPIVDHKESREKALAFFKGSVE